MSTYSNTDWLTQLAADVASLAAGTMTQAAFIAGLLPYTDGWIGIAASDMVLAQKVTDTVSAFITRDTNFDSWINGTVAGGYNSDGTPSDGVAPHGGYYPLTTLAGAPIYFACPAKLSALMNKGDPGGIVFAFSSATTDADPGTGKVALNNAAVASATMAYFSNLEAGGNSIAAWTASFGSAPLSVTGQVIIQEAQSSKFAIFNVIGPTTAGSGYTKVPLSYVAGPGGFDNAARLAVLFIPAGANGDVASTVALASATPADGAAADIFAVASFAQGRWMRNLGPADCSYKVGGTATGASTELTMLAGERIDFKYRSAVRVSVRARPSSESGAGGGAKIEGEAWQ